MHGHKEATENLQGRLETEIEAKKVLEKDLVASEQVKADMQA